MYYIILTKHDNKKLARKGLSIKMRHDNEYLNKESTNNNKKKAHFMTHIMKVYEILYRCEKTIILLVFNDVMCLVERRNLSCLNVFL